MHEYGLALDVAEQVKIQAERAGARRITAVDIEVGGLSHTSVEHLAFWIEDALKEGPGKDAEVRVVRASPSGFCRDCRRSFRQSSAEDEEWENYSLPAACPHCGSSHVMVRGSTGCTILRLELER